MFHGARAVVVLAAFIMIMAPISFASAEETANPDTNINISMDPSKSKDEQKYKELVGLLTPDQQQELKDVEGELAKSINPKFEAKSDTAIFDICAKSDPEFQKSTERCWKI